MSPKYIHAQINRTKDGWADLRPKKSYGDMTLAEFTLVVKPSLDTRTEIEGLQRQIKDAIRRRNAADKLSCAACADVARGVLGDKSEGPNSPFYKELGYVPHNERKSGLARKKKSSSKAA